MKKRTLKDIFSVIVMLSLVAPGLLFIEPFFVDGVTQAADHTNLEEGLPAEVEDAYPTALMNRELQGLLRYERADEGKDRLIAQPRLEYGFARNWQATLTVPFLIGDADKTGSGDIRLEALYNFNTESVHLPAFAIAGGAELPTGKDTEGVDTTVKLIASKMPFTKSYLLHRIHLNLVWKHNSERKDDERSDYYKAIIGFSSRIGKDTMLVLDILRELQREEEKEANIFEIGIRRQMDPLTVVTVGAGAGFGDESPDTRFTVGFQRSF